MTKTTFLKRNVSFLLLTHLCHCHRSSAALELSNPTLPITELITYDTDLRRISGLRRRRGHCIKRLPSNTTNSLFHPLTTSSAPSTDYNPVVVIPSSLPNGMSPSNYGRYDSSISQNKEKGNKSLDNQENITNESKLNQKNCTNQSK